MEIENLTREGMTTQASQNPMSRMIKFFFSFSLSLKVMEKMDLNGGLAGYKEEKLTLSESRL